MKYLLDTNVVIALLSGVRHLSERIRHYDPTAFGLPSIVLHELFYGAFKSRRRAQNLAAVLGLRFEVVDFDKDDARHAGEVRALLAAAGTVIGPFDVLIAGQARARNLVLLSRNIREFERVPGLVSEDWESG